MDNEILALLKENNKLLKEIKALLIMQMYDNNYIEQQDMKAFCINVVADLFAENIKKH